MLTKRYLTYFFLVFVFLFCIGSLKANQETTTPNKKLILSMEDCVKLALENNEKLKGMGLAIQAAENQRKEANAAFWPIFEYEYRVAPVPTDATRAFDSFFEGQLAFFNSIRFKTIVPLFASGQMRTAEKLANGGVIAANENKIKEQEDVTYQVTQLYYGILLASELDSLLLDSIKKIDTKLKEEEAKETPDYSPIELLKLKVFKIDLEKRLAETNQNRDLAKEGLKIQIGAGPEDEIELISKSLKPEVVNLASMEEYLNASLEHRPEFNLLNIGVETKKMQYKLEKMKLGPKAGAAFFIDVGRTHREIKNLGMKDDYNDPFNYSRAGVGIQISGTLDFHGALARIKKTKAEYFKAVWDKEIASKGLQLELKKSFLIAKNDKENVTRAKKAESLAHQMLFLSKSNFDIGIGEKNDYTEALQLVLVTRGQYYKAVFDYNVALADLQQKVGRINYEHLTKHPNIPEYEFFNYDEEVE